MKKLSKSGRDVTDQQIIRWANEAIQRGGKTSKISSFKDPAFKTGIVVCDILNGIRPGSIDYTLVTRGSNTEDASMNAKYAISVARKIGAVLYVLPEDIIECRSKLVSLLSFAMTTTTTTTNRESIGVGNRSSPND
jgi:plastin-1